MPMRAIVVGGQGFLGGAVVRELLNRGASVSVVDRAASQDACDRLFGRGAVDACPGDTADSAALRLLFRGAEEVYNFAGRLGTSELEDDIRAAIDANIVGAVNVFDAALRAGVARVFYPSKPNVWLNTYTITKVAAEQFASIFAERGLGVVTLRYFNAYGPGQAVGPVRKIIPTFALQAARAESLTIFGDGEQTVDMIFSSDLARITVDIMRSRAAPNPLDLGRGIALTVNQVASDVLAHFGGRGSCVHLPMRPGETPGAQLVANIQPLRALLGELSFAEWRQSLAQTLDWYAERAA
jgi:UDP-glucose 4-epimerase